jgi:hypothetical protein
MHNPSYRDQWDNNIKKTQIVKKMNRLQMIYILNKNNGIGMQKRDFFEKKINFKIYN